MGKDRYPGVNPFSAEQQEIFFGREKEKEELIKFIDLETLVVFHSKSGLGKSSLLNAAVIPEIQREGVLQPLSVRLYAYQQGEKEMPADKLREELARQTGPEGKYLDSLIGGHPTIWYYLKRIQANDRDKVGIVLVFDQFEELFSYPTEAVADFAKQLASAVYENIPQPILNRFEQEYLQDENFMTDVEMDLLHQPFKIKILLAIRSDQLSLLSELSGYFPKILGRLYRLEALSVESAEEAILRPAYLDDPNFNTPPFDYSDEALEYILDYLTKGGENSIESYQLQILCHHIEKNILPAKSNHKIEKSDLGDIDAIYENYYANQISKLGDEATQRAARRFIEEGLIQEEDERRLSLHGSQITQFYGISQSLLDKLVNTRLIRPEPHRKGGYIYELSHDSIIKPILKAKRKRIAEEKEQAEAEARRQRELETQRLREENRKERERVRYYRLWLLFAFLFIAITTVATFLYFKNKQNKFKRQAAELERQELELKSEVQRQIAKSSEFTSHAMLESNIDRTLALNLAGRAIELNETNQIALKVRNDLLIDAEVFPFYREVIQGHPNYVSDLAISPDHQYIASGCLDGNIRIWSVDNRLIKTLEGHQGEINDVDWLEDGRILSSSRSGEARMWKEDGTLDMVLNNGYGIYDAEISPNGNLFATAGVGGIVQIWDRYGNLLQQIRMHSADVSTISFSEDSNQLITASLDRSIKMIDLTDYEVTELVSSLPEGVQNMDYFHQGKLLAAGLINGQMKVWRVENDTTLRELVTILAHESRVSDVVFTDNGKKILTCSWDKSAKLWSLEGNLLKTFLGHKDGLRAVAISEERAIVVTGGEDKTLKVWPLLSFSERTFGGFTEDVSCVAFSGDSKRVVVGSYDQTARLYAIEGPEICAVNQGNAIYDAAISGDGKLLATVGNSKLVRLWDDRGELKEQFRAHEDVIRSIAFSPDDQNLLTGSGDSTARLWDLKGNLLQSFTGHEGPVLEAVFSENAQFVLTASTDATARLWSIDGNLLHTLDIHTDRVNSVAFSPDNRHFLTGSWDNSSKLWTIEGTPVVDFLGHTSDINKVAFSNDGQTILSASSDNTVRLWRPDGQELPSIIHHSLSVTDAVFSPDGKFIITGSRDNTARLWRLDIIEDILANIPPPEQEQIQRYGLE